MPETFMDQQTAHASGFTYVLAQIAPASPYGLAAKHALQPLQPGAETVLAAIFAVQAELLTSRRAEAAPCIALEHQLTQLPDWRSGLERLQSGISLSDVDFLGLKQLLYWQAAMQEHLQRLPAAAVAAPLLTDFSPLWQLLDPEGAGTPSFYLADAYCQRLAELRHQQRQLRQRQHRHSEAAEQRLAEQLDLPRLPTGEFRASKNEEQLCQRLSRLPALTVSRTTYTHIYYRRQPDEPEQLWEAQAADLQADLQSVAAAVRNRLTVQLQQYAPALDALLQALGQFDLLLAKVRLAQQWCCTPPQLFTGPARINFVNAHHPQVAAQLAERAARFQPISWQLQAGAAVLTGANMGGKSVALRSLALLTAMAQHGLLVPAEQLELTLVQGIRLLTGGTQSETPGLSRFGSEVRALCRTLPLTEQPYLLLYDEPASGTNPLEGSALAQAVVEHTARQPSINVFATHYAELAQLANVAHWQVIGWSQTDPQRLARAFASGEADLQLDYRLQPVPPGQALPQEALEVARLLGLPSQLITRASEIRRHYLAQ